MQTNPRRMVSRSVSSSLPISHKFVFAIRVLDLEKKEATEYVLDREAIDVNEVNSLLDPELEALMDEL